MCVCERERQRERNSKVERPGKVLHIIPKEMCHCMRREEAVKITQIRLETACMFPVTETISSFMCVP